MIQSKVVNLLIVLCFCVVVAICISTRSYADNEDSSLVIPTQEEILENGYPINERGETYGPDVKNYLKEPDLMLAVNSEGVVGYIRVSDLNGPDLKTPEEAVQYFGEEICVNMFLQDGVTKIGEFIT